jgi:hypothetical protein
MIHNSIITITIILVIATMVWLFGFHTTNSTCIFAITPASIKQVEIEMLETDHIRFITVISRSANNKTVFAYQWINYGFFDVPQVHREERKLQEQLPMTRLKNYYKLKED